MIKKHKASFNYLFVLVIIIMIVTFVFGILITDYFEVDYIKNKLPLANYKQTDKEYRDVIKKCGDIPSDINLFDNIYLRYYGGIWSPNCNYIVFTVNNISSRGTMDERFLEEYNRYRDKYAGVYIYDASKRESKRIDKINLNARIKSWKDNDTLIFSEDNYIPSEEIYYYNVEDNYIYSDVNTLP